MQGSCSRPTIGFRVGTLLLVSFLAGCTTWLPEPEPVEPEPVIIDEPPAQVEPEPEPEPEPEKVEWAQPAVELTPEKHEVVPKPPPRPPVKDVIGVLYKRFS